MRAITIRAYGSDLVEETLPLPQLELPTDVRIAVRATGVNPVDFKKRAGLGGPLDAPLTMGIGGGPAEYVVLGWDGAGVVTEAGPEARFEVGAEVYWCGDMYRQGTNAEQVVVDSRLVGRKPGNLSFAEAAAMPLTLLTAWEALVETCAVKAGQTALVLPGAGGVGSIAIQIAKQRGLHVVATASRPESEAWCREMGADEVWNHREVWGDRDGRTFDHVFCMRDLADEWDRVHPLLAPRGHIVILNPPQRPVDLSPVFLKSGSVHQEFVWTRPFCRSEEERVGAILDEAAGLFESGALRTTLRGPVRSLWGSLGAAHSELEAGAVVGKIVLSTVEYQ